MVNTENVFGFLALATYLATLAPSNLRVVFPALKMNTVVTQLLKHRRSIGISTFMLSVAHASIVLGYHQAELLERNFYIQSTSGLLIITIFALLAFTSNSWSIKKLKKNWKRLHSLTYLATMLLPWHIAAKMAGRWTPSTMVALVLTLMVLCMFCYRRYLEWERYIGI
ncbi:MAG: ferric reductase-like transmembrane domain-containing protein [Phormidesmis sp.]